MFDDENTTPDISLVQAGWTIYGQDGEALGEVVAVDDGVLTVRGEGLGVSHVEIDQDAIVEQDEEQMRAWLGPRARSA